MSAQRLTAAVCCSAGLHARPARGVMSRWLVHTPFDVPVLLVHRRDVDVVRGVAKVHIMKYITGMNGNRQTQQTNLIRITSHMATQQQRPHMHGQSGSTGSSRPDIIPQYCQEASVHKLSFKMRGWIRFQLQDCSACLRDRETEIRPITDAHAHVLLQTCTCRARWHGAPWRRA